MKPPRKIRVSGPSGGGKTYASREISKILKIPAYEMDIDIYHDPTDEYYDRTRSLEERTQLLDSHLKKKEWILEGGYTADWAKKSFDEAEIIILIWPPLWKRWYNITKRTMLGQNAKKQRIKGYFALLGWSAKWEHKRYKFEPYKEKIVEFTSADEAISWVKEKLV